MSEIVFSFKIYFHTNYKGFSHYIYSEHNTLGYIFKNVVIFVLKRNYEIDSYMSVRTFFTRTYSKKNTIICFNEKPRELLKIIFIICITSVVTSFGRKSQYEDDKTNKSSMYLKLRTKNRGKNTLNK